METDASVHGSAIFARIILPPEIGVYVSYIAGRMHVELLMHDEAQSQAAIDGLRSLANWVEAKQRVQRAAHAAEGGR